MSKIFLDAFFSEIKKQDFTPIPHYCQYNLTNWTEALPDDCDVVGVSFWKNDYDAYIPLINHLLGKTKKLLLNISEPTNEYLLDFIEKITHPKIKIFTDIVSNTEKVYNFKTNISWFIGSTNYYAEYQWAKEILYNITAPRAWEPRSKIFDCLLGTKKNHRDIVHSLYNKSKFKDKIDFTYYKDNPDDGVWGPYTKLDESFADHITFDFFNISQSAIVPYYIYNNSYYSIVAETTTFNRFNQYTEKVAKPIIARRPFIAFCGVHYLRNLRSLGFKTFSNIVDESGNLIIDESYDNEDNDKVRWMMAWNQVEKLCTIDPITTLAHFQDILEHNAMHFLNTNWNQEILNELLIPE